MFHFYHVSCMPKSNTAPEHKGCSGCVVPSHLKSAARNSSEKTMCHQFVSRVQSWTLAIQPFRLPAYNLEDNKNVVINIIERDKVINSLIIIWEWSESFRLCAIFDISTYLLQTEERETTRFSIGCHSARTVVAVTWHHLCMISLRYVSFPAVVTRGRPVCGRSRWDLLCWYFWIVLLNVLWLLQSWRAFCLWDMPVLCRARTDGLFPSKNSALCPWSKWRHRHSFPYHWRYL